MAVEGKIITFKEAQELLNQSEQIKHTATPFVVEGLDNNIPKFTALEAEASNNDLFVNIHEKSVTHYKDPNNIYIFSLESINALLRDKNATHLMIIKGSQTKKIDSFEKGQPTLILIPCRDTGEVNNEGKIFNTIGIDAVEHPQVRFEPLTLFNERHVNEISEATGRIIDGEKDLEEFKEEAHNTLFVKMVPKPN